MKHKLFFDDVLIVENSNLICNEMCFSLIFYSTEEKKKLVLTETLALRNQGETSCKRTKN